MTLAGWTFRCEREAIQPCFDGGFFVDVAAKMHKSKITPLIVEFGCDPAKLLQVHDERRIRGPVHAELPKVIRVKLARFMLLATCRELLQPKLAQCLHHLEARIIS